MKSVAHRCVFVAAGISLLYTSVQAQPNPRPTPARRHFPCVGAKRVIVPEYRSDSIEAPDSCVDVGGELEIDGGQVVITSQGTLRNRGTITVKPSRNINDGSPNLIIEGSILESGNLIVNPGAKVLFKGVWGSQNVLITNKGEIFNALYNLVSNAIPETPAGGSITVATRAEDDGLVVEVRDTGRGMSDEVREKLFTDAAISTKPGGTGLGTRIVSGVVHRHCGTIEVDSVLGRGTVFTIHLPFEQPSGRNCGS